MMQISNQIEKNYKVVENLGQGSFGTVYRIVDQKGKSYALKKMHINAFMLDEVHNEIEIMMKFIHPNLVRIYDSYLNGTQTLQIVMEYCEEGDLLNYYKKKDKKLTVNQILVIVKQIVKAFVVMNVKGVFHRDLKPENILITKGTIVKIADFGCAKYLNNGQVSKVGNFSVDKGTPIYSSPQILTDHPYSAKCDIWSMGSLIYFIYYGTHPFMDNSVHNTLQKIQKMTMNKQLSIPENTDLTIQRLLKLTLKYQEKERASWRQLSLNRIFLNKITDITSYIEYLRNVSIIANWIAKNFWSIRKEYNITKNKSEIFAYFIIKFQYSCLKMASQIIERSKTYAFLFDCQTYQNYQVPEKTRKQIQKFYNDNKKYYTSIKKSFQSKKQIYALIQERQPQRIDAFNDLDNSIKSSYKILSQIVNDITPSVEGQIGASMTSISGGSSQRVGDKRVFVVMSRWINFERSFQYEHQPRIQKILSQNTDNCKEIVLNQLQKYAYGVIQ